MCVTVSVGFSSFYSDTTRRDATRRDLLPTCRWLPRTPVTDLSTTSRIDIRSDVSAVSETDVGDQLMLITVLTHFQNFVAVPFFSTCCWYPVHERFPLSSSSSFAFNHPGQCNGFQLERKIRVRVRFTFFDDKGSVRFSFLHIFTFEFGFVRFLAKPGFWFWYGSFLLGLSSLPSLVARTSRRFPCNVDFLVTSS